MQSQYAGPAPVTLSSYVAQVKLQSVSHAEDASGRGASRVFQHGA